MKQGRVQIYSGDGHGKSPAALGEAIIRAVRGENVVMIQFLKGKGIGESKFLQRLEPEIKIFNFEKLTGNFNALSKEKQVEEINNIKNGLSFAKKVLTTGECKLLILDEVLGLLDNGIITVEELKSLIGVRDEDTDIIMTGITIDDKVCALADDVSRIETVK